MGVLRKLEGNSKQIIMVMMFQASFKEVSGCVSKVFQGCDSRVFQGNL